MIHIITGHTMNTYPVENSVLLSGLMDISMFLKAGIIPLFFLISGYGFKEKKPKVLLKKTFSDLIIPYLWVVAAYALISPIFTFLTSGSLLYTFEKTSTYVLSMLIGNTAVRTFWGIPMPWWLTSWYILAVFLAFNFLNLIVKLDKVWKQISMVLLCAVAGYVLFELNFKCFCISQGLIGVGYCYAGYLLKKYDLLERIRTNIWTYVIIVPISVAEGLWGAYDLCGGNFNNVPLELIGGGCTGLLFMLAGVYLGRLEWKAFDWIKQIGVYAYWIIFIHSFEQSGLTWWVWQFAMEDRPLLGFTVELIARILLIVAVCIVLKKLSKYWYNRKMVKNG